MFSIAAATTACGTTYRLRVAQIPLRDDLAQCTRLAALTPDQLPAAAADPDSNADPTFAALLSALPAGAQAAITHAAGDYARRIQLAERAPLLTRDIKQTANNRVNCERQSELVGLIRENNAGPQH